MSEETQAVRIETGEEAALELMKFIAEKENKNVFALRRAIITWIYSSNARTLSTTAREQVKSNFWSVHFISKAYKRRTIKVMDTTRIRTDRRLPFSQQQSNSGFRRL
jgi:hypothetical protein